MKTPIIALLCAGAVLATPLIGLAQCTPEQAQADQALARDQAAGRAAYRSGDKARIARTRATARAAYARDWKADHPRNGCARSASVDQRLAAARERERQAYKSKDPARIAAARAAARPDFAADYKSDKPCGEGAGK